MSPRAKRSVTRSGIKEDLSHAKIAYLIARINRAVLVKTTRALSTFGLTPAQFTALTVLHTFGPLSNAELSRRSFVAPQSMHELLASMESVKLTFRRRVPGGGRTVAIGLTAIGKALLAKCEQHTAMIERQLLSSFDGQEPAQLKEALSRCLVAIEKPK